MIAIKFLILSRKCDYENSEDFTLIWREKEMPRGGRLKALTEKAAGTWTRISIMVPVTVVVDGSAWWRWKWTGESEVQTKLPPHVVRRICLVAADDTLTPRSPRVGQNAAMIGYEGAESGYTYKLLTPTIGRRLYDVNLLCVNMGRGVSKVVISSRKCI